MASTRKLPKAAIAGLLLLGLVPIATAMILMSSTASPQSTSTPKKGSGKLGTTIAGFDGDRAFGYLTDQCKIGPRISGTEGNRQLRTIMADHFAQHGARVERQTFQVRDPLSGKPVEMENIVARWHPDRQRRVVIGAHFDTRPRADKEPNPRKRSTPFLGANDGASGVAVLMELAHMLDSLKTTVAVDLVAFDGEELVYDEEGEYFLGSSHFAEQYKQQRSSGAAATYVAGIVVDMVGDKTLEIFPDDEGDRRAPQLRRSVWAVARKLGANGFKENRGFTYDVRDDHLPLLDAGIPAIDIIDFNYGPKNSYWHTSADTPDKCSAASLAQVGGVLAEWLRGL